MLCGKVQNKMCRNSNETYFLFQNCSFKFTKGTEIIEGKFTLPLSSIFVEDLSEGKYNFPIIHAIRNFPGDSKVETILKQKTQDLEMKKYCVELLEASGSFEYSKMTMSELDERITKEIQKLGGNSRMMYLMDKLGNWKQTIVHNAKI